MSQNDKVQSRFGQSSGADPQGGPTDLSENTRSASADLDRWLALLRKAMEKTGWTCDALDVHWGTSRGYAWRLVNGEKTWSVERLLSLPDDLEAKFEQLRAESFGLLVVERTDDETAKRNLASGLFNLLASAPQLPAKAGAPAKADLRSTKKAEAI